MDFSKYVWFFKIYFQNTYHFVYQHFIKELLKFIKDSLCQRNSAPHFAENKKEKLIWHGPSFEELTRYEDIETIPNNITKY